MPIGISIPVWPVLLAYVTIYSIWCDSVARIFFCTCSCSQSLLEACVTDTGAIDFGRSGATGLAKQVCLVTLHLRKALRNGKDVVRALGRLHDCFRDDVVFRVKVYHRRTGGGGCGLSC